MDFESSELFPSLCTNTVQAAPVWKKSSMPGLELATENSFERLDIPKENLLKKTLGPSISDICKSLMTRKKVSVELSSNKRTGMVTLIIHGSAIDVLASKRELLSLLTIPKIVTFKIPNATKAFVIGKGGSMLKKIIEHSMTKIVIQKNDQNDAADVQVEITGDDQGVEIAQNEIMEVVKKQTANYRGKTSVEKLLHHFIGPKISGLEKEYNVKIHVPPLYDQNEEVKNEEIAIIGEMENVLRAIDNLNGIVKDINLGTIAVPLKKAQHRFIFGKKGSGKHEILEKTGCLVLIPNSSETSETVTIKGPQHMLSMALQAVLEKANSVLIGTVDCNDIMPLSESQLLLYFRFLFSRELSTIKEIQAQHSINIYRHSTLPTVLEIQGHTRKEFDDGITAVKSLICSHAKYVYPQMIKIPNELHPYIIGKRGQNITKLKKLPGVDNRLLDVFTSMKKDNSNELGLIVFRLPFMTQLEFEESNKEAEQVISLISKLVLEDATTSANIRSEQLTIDSRFHGRLIGSGGSVMKEILGPLEKSVKMIFGSSKNDGDSLDSNMIIVRGEMTGVKQVCKKIQGLVDQWKKIESLTSFSQNVAVGLDLMNAMFPDFDGSMGTFNSCSLSGIVREIRQKIPEILELKIAVEKDLFNIYSHRSFHMRFVWAPNELTIFGPKLIVPLAIDIIKSKVHDISHTLTIELSLFDPELVPEAYGLELNHCDRVLGRFIGKQGRNVKKMAEKYNVLINFSNSKFGLDDKLSSENIDIKRLGLLTLKGFEGDVIAVQVELLELMAKEIKNSYQLKFDIPQTSLGYILSHNDFSKKKLKDNHSVRLTTTNNTEENTSVILEGEKCKCDFVKSLILERVDEMINYISAELHIPYYLHKTLIGPKGQNIRQIIDSLKEFGKVFIDTPKQYSRIPSDTVNIRCHKDAIDAVRARVDDSLSVFLFSGKKRLCISCLSADGSDCFVTLDLTDFSRICVKNGDRLIGITRKLSAWIFIEKELDDSVMLRLVGETKSDSEKLKAYLMVIEMLLLTDQEEKCISISFEIPTIILNKDFEENSSESFFIRNLMSKLKKEFDAELESDPKSGNMVLRCTARKESALRLVYALKLKELEEHSFLSHVNLPSEVIPHIIGKGGENLKRIRSISSSWIDVYYDLKTATSVAIICAKSSKSVETANFEIEKILNHHTPEVAKKQNKALADDAPVVITDFSTPNRQFPPGYSDNFSKKNQQLLFNHSNIEKQKEPIDNIGNDDIFEYAGDANFSSLNSSQNSTLHDNEPQWKTIKLGKAVIGDVFPGQKKKKKKKRAAVVNDLAEKLLT